MMELDFYGLYDNIVPNVCNEQYNKIPARDKEEYDVFLSNLLSRKSIKSSIKRNYDSSVMKIEKQGLFNDNETYMNCIKISSLCDALIRNKPVCFTVKEGAPTELLMINYSVAIEVVEKSLIYWLNKALERGTEELLYPSLKFKEILLLSIILNDNTHSYNFDILSYSSILLLLFDYNKELLQKN